MARTKIALIGAGGATFGSLTVYEAVRAEGLRGSELVLIDIDEARLELTRAAGERMNEAMGRPFTITVETDTALGVEGADFVVISVEQGRWRYWKQDLEIPRAHGSLQDMGENGGPGGLFHALRTIPLVLGICRTIEEVCPEAFVINVTNPLPRVNMAIHRATSLRCIGDCPELRLALPRLASYLLVPPTQLDVGAWGLNHFTWIHELSHSTTGEDLYPRLRRHVARFPFLHGKLARQCFDELGRYPVSSDSHIGEYLPSRGSSSRSVLPSWFPYQLFSELECSGRVLLTKWYGEGRFPLPFRLLPKAIEGVMLLVEALVTGCERRIGAVNVLNRGHIPNLPDWAVVEVPARTVDGSLVPRDVPPLDEPLATLLRDQCEIQSLIVDAVLQKDPELAIRALCSDPLAPPTEAACRCTFEEVLTLQRDVMPF